MEPGQVLTCKELTAVLHVCRQSGQARSVRVRELEGQLEAVRSHYHGKVRALEVKLQVRGPCRAEVSGACAAQHSSAGAAGSLRQTAQRSSVPRI